MGKYVFTNVAIKIEVFYSCHTRVIRVAVVSFESHSRVTRIACVAVVSLVSGTRVAK